MTAALIGRKLGMTQLFDDKGQVVPVTVIEAGPCTILQVKTPQRDGYSALQVGFQENPKKVTKPMLGHFKKAGQKPKRFIREIPPQPGKEYKTGDLIKIDIFENVKRVSVTGITKGRGFTGMVKRWSKHRGPESHGSMNVRAPGSIAGYARLTHVHPGHHMPGRYGFERVTAKNLKVARIDRERNLLLVKGAVPGPTGRYVLVRSS